MTEWKCKRYLVSIGGDECGGVIMMSWRCDSDECGDVMMMAWCDSDECGGECVRRCVGRQYYKYPKRYDPKRKSTLCTHSWKC